MNIEQTKAAIAVMQAFVDGKEVEFKLKSNSEWVTKSKGLGFGLSWDWASYDYRIKPSPRTLYNVVNAVGIIVDGFFTRQQAERQAGTVAGRSIIESVEVLK